MIFKYIGSIDKAKSFIGSMLKAIRKLEINKSYNSYKEV